MSAAVPSCLRLLRQLVCLAFSLALANTGTWIATKMAIIAISTNSSMRVKPDLRTSLCLCVCPKAMRACSGSAISAPITLAQYRPAQTRGRKHWERTWGFEKTCQFGVDVLRLMR